LVDQTKASSDFLELFMWGERFLQIWEMGKLEGSEEVEMVLRRHRRKLGSKEKERSWMLEYSLRGPNPTQQWC